MKVRIDIYATGDYSGGIQPYNESIELSDWDMDYDEHERERVRDIFQRAFSELVDGKVDVSFGDECGMCHKLQKLCQCEG